MKSVEQMKSEMTKRLEKLESRRESLEHQAASIDQRLGEVRQEIGRLNGAIKALDGVQAEPTVTPEMYASLKSLITAPPQLQPVKELTVPTKFDHAKEDLDASVSSERPPAPQGFHWGKNSFGEEALVKDGVELPPMEEPIVPTKPFSPATPVVPISDNFDDPKDLY